MDSEKGHRLEATVWRRQVGRYRLDATGWTLQAAGWRLQAGMLDFSPARASGSSADSRLDTYVIYSGRPKMRTSNHMKIIFGRRYLSCQQFFQAALSIFGRIDISYQNVL